MGRMMVTMDNIFEKLCIYTLFAQWSSPWSYSFQGNPKAVGFSSKKGFFKLSLS